MPRRFRLLVWLAFVVTLFAWLHVSGWPQARPYADLILIVTLAIAAYLAYTSEDSPDRD